MTELYSSLLKMQGMRRKKRRRRLFGREDYRMILS
jgi:hypothetical protein